MDFAQKVFSGLTAASALFSLNPYCIPYLPCYPEPAVFASLNHSIGGRLIRPPIPEFNCAAPECFVQEWRADQPGLVMFTNASIPASSRVKEQKADGCAMSQFETGFGLTNDNTSSFDDVGRGRIPEYVVEAASAEDIVKGVDFARRHNLRLRVKSTGHDYLGRSSDPGSFAIWTHRLKSTSFNPEFIPHGADSTVLPTPALIAGSGVQVLDLYTAADKAGVVVTGGVSKSVGAAGGFSLGGGHGPLGPLHGLAVDNILEITVVLENGSIVKASPYNHPTLFTALRGGGSAFGVVVEIVLKAFAPPRDGFIGVLGNFSLVANAKDPDGSWKALLREWIAIQPALSDAGFSGYSYVRKTLDTPFAYVLPRTSADRDVDYAKKAFASLSDFVSVHPDIELNLDVVSHPTWFEFWSGDFTSALESTDAVGINLLLGSRLIPRTEVEKDGNGLADFLSSAQSPSIVHLVAGGAVSKTPDFPNTVNPAWREALLHIDLPISWAFNASLPQIRGLQTYLTSHTKALGAFSTFADGVQASYPSESDYNEEEWQDIWYGKENYATLLAAKKEYDPAGVFSGRKVPGSEFVGY